MNSHGAEEDKGLKGCSVHREVLPHGGSGGPGRKWHLTWALQARVVGMSPACSVFLDTHLGW